MIDHLLGRIERFAKSFNTKVRKTECYIGGLTFNLLRAFTLVSVWPLNRMEAERQPALPPHNISSSVHLRISSHGSPPQPSVCVARKWPYIEFICVVPACHSPFYHLPASHSMLHSPPHAHTPQLRIQADDRVQLSAVPLMAVLMDLQQETMFPPFHIWT